MILSIRKFGMDPAADIGDKSVFAYLEAQRNIVTPVSLISLADASKDFGIRTLFEGLTLHVREGDRLGLIGPNGAGKSTLLSIAFRWSGTARQWRGRCSARLRVELVGQDSRVDPGADGAGAGSGRMRSETGIYCCASARSQKPLHKVRMTWR